MHEHRVDIVVPVFHEPENLQTFYQQVVAHTHADWRLLIVYDFDEDTTLPVARDLIEKDARVRLVRNRNRGALNAIKAGFRAAECEAVLTAMVDDPQRIVQAFDTMVDAFYSRDVTIVVASRYMRGGSHTGGPLMKGLLSRLAGLSLHLLIRLPAHDATYNTRLYRKSYLDSITIESTKGFEVALEILIKAHLAGRSIIEIPVHWTERDVGTSRFKIMQWIWAYAYWYWYGIGRYWFSRMTRMRE